jgi:hypothetical protein
MKNKILTIILLFIFSIMSYYLGYKMQQKKAKTRLTRTVSNDETDPSDTATALDRRAHRNTRGEPQNETRKIRKDTAKVRHLLDTQE